MRVNHKQFTEAMRLLRKFNGKSDGPAIFGCAKLTVGPETLVLHKRDGDAEIVVSMPCARNAPPPLQSMTLVVPIEATIKALKAVKPDASKSLEIDGVPDKPADFRVGPLTLLTGLDTPADLPAALAAPEPVVRTVDGAFLDALARVAPTMSKNTTTRYSLCGAWIDGALVATDGHRLHLHNTLDAATLIEGAGGKGAKPYFPAQIVNTILAFKKPQSTRLGFRYFEKKIDNRDEGFLDGAFRCALDNLGLTADVRWQWKIEDLPNYKELVSDSANVRMTLDAQTLLADLKLCAAHAADAHKFEFVSFRCNAAGVTMRATSAEGQILDRPQAPVAYQLDGDAGQGGFNLHYLEEAIEAVADNKGEIVLAFSVEEDQLARVQPDPLFPREAYAPLCLTSAAHPECKALIMPCRL
jgi:hypothetical protein